MRTSMYRFIQAAESTSGSPSKTGCTSFKYYCWSKHSPSGFYSFGAYGDSIPAPSGDLGDTISGRLVDSQLLNMLDLVGFILNQKKSELDLTQDLQFLGIHLPLDLGKALLPESKAWEIVLAHAIYPPSRY